jgi:hypothetical protein
MTVRTRSVGARARLLGVALALAFATSIALGSVAPPTAQAVTGCATITLYPQAQHACGTMYNLRETYVFGTDWTGAGAHINGSWTLYGNYITAYGNACHSYAAGNYLGPIMQNQSGSNTQYSMTLVYDDQNHPDC